MANKSNKSRPALIIPVILSGGSGTRLWPLSRSDRPKQFLPLVSERTLFQETLLRLKRMPEGVGAPIVVCNEAHRFLVAEQLREIEVEPHAIVLEPAGRNTAPAVAVAALIDPILDPILLVLPADHVILDTDAFIRAIAIAAQAASAGHLVTFGIVPDKPETGYGYLRKGDERGDWSLLDEFVEKPDPETAQRYVESGEYLWNSGMFLFSASAYIKELAHYEPAMLQACERALAGAQSDQDFTRLGETFLECRSDSIDYAVMEKTENAAVVALDAGWSDVGSWAALHEVLKKDAEGNVLTGDVLAEGSENSYVLATHRLVAAVGLQNVVVIETEDAVLVMGKDNAQQIKRAVDALKQANRSEIHSRAKD